MVVSLVDQRDADRRPREPVDCLQPAEACAHYDDMMTVRRTVPVNL
jgi:hypothetical protein